MEEKNICLLDEEVEILSIEEMHSARSTTMYDFQVDGNNNFFANGILVHNCIDEVDVVQDPRALKEAQMIPSTYKHYFPLTVYLSTRKFAGGLMEKTLKKTIEAGGKVLRWNIIDVAERITHKEAQIHKPKVTRFLSRDLPMINLSPEEWSNLPEEEQNKYEKFEAYAGIAEHKMLPIMKNYLVDRPQDDVGDLYKPLVSVHNNFKQLDSDMADAQLLCNKPSSSGLVYPRFSEVENVLSVEQALKKILGEDPEAVSFEYLKEYLKDLGVTFIGGGDWGFSDKTSLVVLALLPTGEVFHMTTIALAGLELDDIVKYAVELDREYGVSKWFVDQNYPAYIKTLSKSPNSLKIPKFKKVVEDGIAALQGKIVNSTNTRKYFVIDTPENKCVIDAFGEYRWQMDGKGEIVEGKPFHDKDGVADIMDSIRYPMQNLFTKGAKPIAAVTGKDATPDPSKITKKAKNVQEAAEMLNSQIIYGQLPQAPAKHTSKTENGAKKKRILWY